MSYEAQTSKLDHAVHFPRASFHRQKNEFIEEQTMDAVGKSDRVSSENTQDSKTVIQRHRRRHALESRLPQKVILTKDDQGRTQTRKLCENGKLHQQPKSTMTIGYRRRMSGTTCFQHKGHELIYIMLKIDNLCSVQETLTYNIDLHKQH